MNWNMLGHEWAVNLLKQHVANGQARHAYLFTGPQGVGRRTLAVRLAQALNCMQPPSPGDFCDACRACTQILAMQHADLFILQAEHRGAVLKVEQVRELQRSLSYAPYEANYRIALMLHFEEANQSAANALLKTLEEPASQVVLILTAENAEILLPTIVSRCEVLRLRPLPATQVAQGLREIWQVPADQATLLASISAGRLGYALYLYQNTGKSTQRTDGINELIRLLDADRPSRFRFAEAMSRDKEAARDLLFTWLSFWRDMLLQTACVDRPVVNLDYQEQVRALAQHYGVDEAYRACLALGRTIELLDKNINSRLALEVLMLDLPG